MKFLVKTLGCKVNQYDAFTFEASYEALGNRKVDLILDAEQVFIFGCSVTSNASKQARQLINKIKRENSKAEIIVAGCYSRLFADEVENLNVKPWAKWENEIENIFPLKQSKSRAYLKIQDGCSYNCNYCIIRIARGESKSVPLNELINKAKMLADQGYPEIVLCGIHIGTYGNDFSEKTTLSNLLSTLFKEVPNVRFRLSSLHPHEIDDQLIGFWGDKNLCRYLHLSIQSGSDDVLRRMNRQPARKLIDEIFNKILQKDSNTFISADLIVGYPTETDGEFGETYQMVKNLPFAWLHVFPFSKREGTVAASLPLIDKNIVQERMQPLLDIAKVRKFEFVKKNVGIGLETVVTTEDEDDVESGKIEEGFVKSLTDNYIVMVLPKRPYRHKGVAIGEKVIGFELWGNWK